MAPAKGTIEICNFFPNELILEDLKKRKIVKIDSDFLLPPLYLQTRKSAIPQHDVTSWEL